MNDRENRSIGEVQIADEVVGSIAALAAMEIEGVANLAGGFTREIAGRFGVKNPGKGVKVDVAGNSVFLDMSLQLYYGYSIPKVSKAVQERAVTAVENMTGLKVEEVNVKVTGIVNEENQ
ncbi:MAG: Asp23/Gls24 family envelope stress response protein [Lachnospiraceae bacterium]|nr:Asp23/Gls24 family envelope stress response protein [Lachnospiraceae bacterium]